MKKILIFTGLADVGKNMVGTAIIYPKLATLLKNKGMSVSLVIPQKINNIIYESNYHLYNEKSNQKLIRQSDVVIFGAYPPIEPLLLAYKNKKKIITYLWSIAPIGSLEFKDFSNKEKQKSLHQYITHSYNLSLLVSDKIFCRDQKAKDLVLGSLVSLGRVNLDNYYSDKTLQKFLEVAPFGLETKTPKHKKNVYRGVIQDINKNDWLLLWNGGIWNWHDPETLIKAMTLVKKKNKKIKLIFQGFKHPHQKQPLSQKGCLALKLTQQKKLINQNIFFIDQWFPYEERGNYLTEANVGITISPDIPEANYFIKTRFYDYLWAELPIITTSREAFAGEIEKNNLGLVVPEKNPTLLAQAILSLAQDKKKYQKQKNEIKKFKKSISWSKNLSTVVNFCQKPFFAPDREDKRVKEAIKFYSTSMDKI